MKYQKKYKHTTGDHNLTDPGLIVPHIINLTGTPKSVVDIGCGLGTFLKVFKHNGVTDVLGIDGPWVDRELLYQNINPEEFKVWSLEEAINIDKKYDLVISLEVAEHVSSKSADIFVESLVKAGDIILFSASIPFQGGQNHINEQWLSYWKEKFSKHGLVVYDVVRPVFWKCSDLLLHYRQNIVLVGPENLKFNIEVQRVPMINIVHYEVYEAKARILKEIIKGKAEPYKYLGWFIVSIFVFLASIFRNKKTCNNE